MKHIIGKRLFYTTIAAFLVMPFSVVLAQEQKKQLSLQETLETALKNNLEIEAASYAPRIASYIAKAEAGTYIPRFSLNAGRRDASTPITGPYSVFARGASSIEDEASTFDAALSQKLPFGTELSIFAQSEKAQGTFTDFEKQQTGSEGISVVQPLLKNAGFASNNLRLRNARIESEISGILERDIVMNTLAELEKHYWDILFLREAKALSEESLLLAQRLHEDTQKRVEAGTVSELELAQTQAGVAQRKDDVLLSAQALLVSSRNLRRALGFEISDELIDPVDFPAVPDSDYDPAVFTAKALACRADFISAKLSLERFENEKAYYKNQLLPSLDLAGSAMYHGSGKNTSELMDSIDDREFSEWRAGLQLTQPLWLTKELNMFRAARLRVQAHKTSILNLETIIRTSIANASLAAATSRKRIDLAQESVAASQRALDAENKKYEVGRSTPRQVLDYQNDLVRAKVQKIGALVGYMKSAADLYAASGTYLEYRKIKKAG